ncbi:hypothetical protein P7C73_g5521, partial [Tremellales sp. Uapishka_1]
MLTPSRQAMALARREAGRGWLGIPSLEPPTTRHFSARARIPAAHGPPREAVHFRPPLRCLHTSLRRFSPPDAQPNSSTHIQGATDLSHSEFLSSSSPSSSYDDSQPSKLASSTTASQGKLSPTSSHLFKLVLPLPTSTTVQPTAFLLHPSQPLSHLSRLISGSLPIDKRDVDITYLALTGDKSDLDNHLRHAESEKAQHNDEGGPLLQGREEEKGRFQRVAWSQSTDLSDFIKQSCLDEKFTIVIQRRGEDDKTELEVLIPTFTSRTVYLRKRLLELTRDLNAMTKQKKEIDLTAHKGAQKLLIAGLGVGVVYWAGVIRMTFFTDAGWDLMEPVTWATGFAGLLSSIAYLIYHNREVSYSSFLDLSVSSRQKALYVKHGLDVEKWTEMGTADPCRPLMYWLTATTVSEAKTLRREISRIAADYDYEWKGELEVEDKENRKIDIDKTIDEASDLASQTEEKKRKAKDLQRKGEVDEEESEEESKVRGKEKAEEVVARKE